ncbi:MAG: acylneuraminate cytidylyltransferase family protein [Rhodospirillaceae bacterium]|jgi:CMP-N,N'-diacetyllegionaminic acid synthase|nr:acylneuraminate cytidylyltransferase family protein [Rhodospirillaceae bacterium]MBT5245524.1 acylneuraminate cytidylyltransferase family protein [Rhodospirillaceae bacterium]MBT5561006.1 acylneuraminate cytidylyltransferase family protein [Rhodospirillaceae bacterium]MBT6240642.1 acylneuraminate cytidylyltransferase family protein [Rhodospirillaceae bacterium]
MTSQCAIIPARGGSKGVPGKNIRTLRGHPMIAYSIIAARECANIDRIIVSTDSPEIAKIATSYGAEVPFMRPPELAGDLSPAIDFMTHALDQLALENDKPDMMVMLLPTTPLRDSAVIDEAITRLQQTPEATGLRSAHELPEPPQKMMGIKDGYLCGLFPDDPRPEYFNLPRQTFPIAYHPNGYVEIVRRETLINEGTLYGSKIQSFITPFTIEIDAPEDFDYLQYTIDQHGHPLIDKLDTLGKA